MRGTATLYRSKTGDFRSSRTARSARFGKREPDLLKVSTLAFVRIEIIPSFLLNTDVLI